MSKHAQNIRTTKYEITTIKNDIYLCLFKKKQMFLLCCQAKLRTIYLPLKLLFICSKRFSRVLCALRSNIWKLFISYKVSLAYLWKKLSIKITEARGFLCQLNHFQHLVMYNGVQKVEMIVPLHHSIYILKNTKEQRFLSLIQY